MAEPVALNLHACGIVLATTGVVVVGPSGSGKSRLCHLLLEIGHQDRWWRHMEDHVWTRSVGTTADLFHDRVQHCRR